MTIASVYGQIILDQKVSAEELLGPDRVSRAIATMPPDARRALERLMPMSWLGLEEARAFHQACADEAGQELYAWHRQVVRNGTKRTFTGIWRVFLRFTSLEMLVKRSAVIYQRIYDEGRMTACMMAPTVAIAEVHDWPDMPEFELAALCVGIEAAIELTGKRAEVSWEQRPNGAWMEVMVVRGSQTDTGDLARSGEFRMGRLTPPPSGDAEGGRDAGNA